MVGDFSLFSYSLKDLCLSKTEMGSAGYCKHLCSNAPQGEREVESSLCVRMCVCVCVCVCMMGWWRHLKGYRPPTRRSGSFPVFI